MMIHSQKLLVPTHNIFRVLTLHIFDIDANIRELDSVLYIMT